MEARDGAETESERGVALGDLVFLIECKDKDTVDIEAIAKLRN